METPFDVLNARLGKIRDNGDIDFDNTAAALDIDMELQAKFLFIPFAEIEAIEIEENREHFYAGSGPEACQAGETESPAWLYNHGVNALALYFRLKKKEEDDALAEKLAARPEPGVYLGRSHGGGINRFTVIVTEDRRVLVPARFNSSLEPAMNDSTDVWDERAKDSWTLQRIDLTDGTVQA